MPSDVHEPSSGTPHPDPVETDPKIPDSLDITGPDAAPGPIGQANSTSSGDEISVLLAETRPDPFLDEFTPERTPEVEPAPPSEGVSAGSFDAVGALNAFTDPAPIEPVIPAPPPPPIPDAVPGHPIPAPSPFDSRSSDSIDPLGSLGVATGSDSTSQPASFDAFPQMDLSAPPPRPAPPQPAAEEGDDDEDDEEDEYDDLPPRRSSIGFMLLLSYASAVTIGLIWILWTGRRLRESEDDPFPAVAADSSADPGKRAGQARKVTPPPALAADHLTGLGKAVRLGDLEATPLEVASGPVRLSRSFGDSKARDGGTDALKLRLRLKNVSKDAIFSPLDEGFLRERGPETRDSLIETSDGQQIDMYPLAVASELAIAGQEFRELKPGDSYETWVVSAPDSAGRKAPEMTWRVRLRTGIEKTDTLGVRFHDKDIKPNR